MNITSNSSIIFIRNVDNDGNPISISIPNESITVFDNKGYLHQVPDKYHRVSIYDTVDGDMVEIDINEDITTENQYKLPYGTERLIYFHPNKEGKVLNATYYGKGFIFIPSDNICSQTDASGNVTETLQDIINTGKMTWQTPVATYANIASTYPSPEESWTVQVMSNNYVYRYDGTKWKWIQVINFGNAFIKTVDDTDDITQGATNLFVTSAEKTLWTNKSAYFVDTASTDSYLITITGITNYTQLVGVPIFVKVKTANTTSATLNVNSLGAKNICRGVNTSLLTGDILANQIIELVYDGTQFQLKSQGADVSQASKVETLINKTLTAPKITSASYIADSNGNILIKFPSTVPYAANEITVSNAAGGDAPSISATGGTTNIPFDIKTKGTGLFRTFVNGVISFVSDAASSAVNYLKIKASVSGSAPTIEAIGDDTNIDINLIPKGTGKVKFKGVSPEDLISTHEAKLVTEASGVHGLKIESGTWAPTLAGAATAGSNTYAYQHGYYQKIGNTVIAHGFLTTSAVSGMVGELIIKGLPYAATAGLVRYSNSIIGSVNGITYSGHLGALVRDSQNYISLYGNNVPLNYTAAAAATNIAVTAIYQTAS